MRPKTKEGEKLNLFLDRSTKGKAFELAKRQGISVSALVERLVDSEYERDDAVQPTRRTRRRRGEARIRSTIERVSKKREGLEEEARLAKETARTIKVGDEDLPHVDEQEDQANQAANE